MSYEYIIDHIPMNTPNDRRPADRMVAETITLHNTGNEKSSARNERNWLTNPSNDRTASFHKAIDEKEIIECLPDNEHAWAAGDGRGDGNMKSIHIEICESGNYALTIENTIDHVAKMLHERNWGVDKLRRHWDWSRKICPRLMYEGGSWATWKLLVSKIDARLSELKNPPKPVAKETPTVTNEGDENIMKVSGALHQIMLQQLEEITSVEKYGKTALSKIWLTKYVNGELTNSEAIALLFAIRAKNI
jgi:N-acetylmuramoyl-L-alanine amidase CwlA